MLMTMPVLAEGGMWAIRWSEVDPLSCTGVSPPDDSAGCRPLISSGCPAGVDHECGSVKSKGSVELSLDADAVGSDAMLGELVGGLVHVTVGSDVLIDSDGINVASVLVTMESSVPVGCYGTVAEGVLHMATCGYVDGCR